MEDFVSFETAKKLKEKGFEIPTRSIVAMYNEQGVFFTLTTAADYQVSPSGYRYRCYYDYDDFDDHDYIAPTISQVLKWLREEKKITIQPLIVRGGTWDAQITFTDDDDEALKNMFGDRSFWIDECYSYEVAALAGIEYVLNKII